MAQLTSSASRVDGLAAESAFPLGSRRERMWTRDRASLLASAAIAALVLALGIHARLHKLGQRPVAIDEFYSTQASEAWMQTGTPGFPGGGLYMRGIGPHFLIMCSAALFGHNELSYRLPSVLCGLAAIVPLGLLAYRHAGAFGLFVAITMLLLSSWHIEFSRFARMYSPLLLVTLWLVYALERGFLDDSRVWRWGALACVSLSAFVHESHLILSGLFLFTTLFSPKPTTPGGRRAWIVAGIASVVLAYLWTKYSTAMMYLTVVSDDTSDILLPVRLPDWQILTLVGSSGVWIAAHTACCIVAISLAVWARLPGRYYPALLLLCLLQPGLAACYLLFLACLGASNRHAGHGGANAVLVTMLACCLLLVLCMKWAGMEAHYTAALDTPAIYRTVVSPWLQCMPVLGGFCFAALACAGTRIICAGYCPRRDFLPLAVILLLLAVALLDGVEGTTRYTYFVYPLLTVVLLSELSGIRFPFSVSRKGAAFFVLLLFLCSRDFHLEHIVSPTTPSISFRYGSYARYRDHWYRRADFRALADEVDRELDGRGVLVCSKTAIATWRYLDRKAVHVLAVPEEKILVAAEAGKLRYLWTGCAASSVKDGVQPFLEAVDVPSHCVFAFRVDHERDRRWLAALGSALQAQRLSLERFFTEQSGDIALYRVIPSAISCQLAGALGKGRQAMAGGEDALPTIPRRSSRREGQRITVPRFVGVGDSHRDIVPPKLQFAGLSNATLGNSKRRSSRRAARFLDQAAAAGDRRRVNKTHGERTCLAPVS